MVSGNYIFSEPLKEYFEEQKQLEQSQQSGAPGAAAATKSSKK